MNAPAAVELVRTAPPPWAPRRMTAYLAIRQYLGLVQVMLKEYRSTWYLHVLFGGFMPLGMLFLFRYAGGEITPERALFLIGGNMTSAIAFGPTMMMINRIGWGRHTREFDYWAGLPVPKVALVLALASSALLFALPGTFLVYLVGSRLLGSPLEGGLLLLPLSLLGAAALVGFGAFIGALARDGQSTTVLANLFVALVTFFSPTLIPPDAMPLPLRLLSYLNPIAYVADGFRQVLQGNFGLSLAYDVVMQVTFAVVCLTLVQRKLDWRTA